MSGSFEPHDNDSVHQRAPMATHHDRVSSATSFTHHMGESPRKSVPGIHVDSHGTPAAGGCIKAPSAVAGVLGDRNVSSQWSCQLTNDSILTSAACTTTSGSFALPHQSSSVLFFNHSQPSIVFAPGREEHSHEEESAPVDGPAAMPPSQTLRDTAAAASSSPGAQRSPSMQPSRPLELTSSSALFLSHHNTTWSPLDSLSATAKYVDGQSALEDWVPTPIASTTPTPATTPPHASLLRSVEPTSIMVQGADLGRQRRVIRQPPWPGAAGRGQQRDRACTMHAAPPSRRPPSPPALQCSASAPFFPPPPRSQHATTKGHVAHQREQQEHHVDAMALEADARVPSVLPCVDAEALARCPTPQLNAVAADDAPSPPEQLPPCSAGGRELLVCEQQQQEQPTAAMEATTMPPTVAPITTTNALWTDVLLHEMPPTIDAVCNAIATYGDALQRDATQRAQHCALVLVQRSLLQSDRSSPAPSRGCSPTFGHQQHQHQHQHHAANALSSSSRSMSPSAVTNPCVDSCTPTQPLAVPTSTSLDAVAQVTAEPNDGMRCLAPPTHTPVTLTSTTEGYGAATSRRQVPLAAPPLETPCGQLYRAIAEVAQALSRVAAKSDVPATAACPTFTAPPFVMPPPFQVSSGTGTKTLPPPPPYPTALHVSPMTMLRTPSGIASPPPPPPPPPPMLVTMGVQQQQPPPQWSADRQQLKYALGTLLVDVSWWLQYETTHAEVPAHPALDRHSDRDEQRVYDLMEVIGWPPEAAASVQRVAHAMQCAGNALVTDSNASVAAHQLVVGTATQPAGRQPNHGKAMQPSERSVNDAIAQLGTMLARIAEAVHALHPARMAVQATHDLLERAVACLRQRASLRRKKTSMYDALESGGGLVGDITAHLSVIDALCDDNVRLLTEVYDRLCSQQQHPLATGGVSWPASPTPSPPPSQHLPPPPPPPSHAAATIAHQLRHIAASWYRMYHSRVEANVSVFSRSALILAAFPEQQQTPPSIMLRLLQAVARASGIHAAPLHFVAQSHSYCGLWIPDNAIMAWCAVGRNAHAVAAYASPTLLPYVSLLDACRLCLFLPSVPLRHPAQLGAAQQPSSVGSFWQMHLSSRGSTANLVLLSNTIGHLVNAMPVYIENVGATRALNVWVPLAGRDAWMLWASQVQAFVDHSGELLALHHSPGSLRTNAAVGVGHHHPFGGGAAGAAGPYRHQAQHGTAATARGTLPISSAPNHSGGGGGGFEEVVLARKKNRTRCGKDGAPGSDNRRSTTAV